MDGGRQVQNDLNELTGRIVDSAFQVHTTLGPGLLERVYQRALCYELVQRGIVHVEQLPIPIRYKSLAFDEGFRADVLVEDRVILELKSVESLAPVHHKQLLTYLRLAGKRVGLLINFGAPLIRDGIVRIVNG